MTPPTEMTWVAQSTPAPASAQVKGSTAHTTPDESFTSSPTSQTSKIRDVSKHKVLRKQESKVTESLNTMQQSIDFVTKKICCIGAGYVGGPTSAVIAYHNPQIQVTVVDRDASRIAQWNSKHPPLYEPGLREILRVARDGSKPLLNRSDQNGAEPGQYLASSTTLTSGNQCPGHSKESSLAARKPNLFFSVEASRSISEADMVLIAVNTQTKKKGVGAGKATDMTTLEAVLREIAVYAKPGAILVEKSTVPCRTADLIQKIMQIYRPGLHFEVLSNPEFLSAGTAISNLMYPSRIVIGNAPTPSGLRAAQALQSVYSWIPPSIIISTSVYSAELAKLVANAMLAQRISSINSISAICERVGADVSSIAQATMADPRIGTQYLTAGVGFGGSCFGKDMRSLIYLAEGLGLIEVADYWQQVLLMNTWQMSRFAQRVVEKLNGTLVGKKIAVLGYAFKAGTDDMRDSPALEVIKILLEEDPEEIAVFDLLCRVEVMRKDIGRLLGEDVLRENGGPVTVFQDVYEVCRKANAVLVMTECDAFQNSFPEPRMPEQEQRPDLQPFMNGEPKGTQILGLQGYNMSNMEKFVDEPACQIGCPFCADEAKGTTGGNEMERLDWARVAYHLEKPKWVFEGRGVLDIVEMEKLGVSLESIGR